MARLQGITGGLSGKMGSAVFRQRGGQTIAAQYQPIVKNPNSESQQEARAKFKLMSQLAAIMQEGFGTMGVAERPARGSLTPRNAFFKLNYHLIETTQEANGVSAKIPMEQLKLTSSFRALSPLRLSAEPQTDGVIATMNYIPAEVAAVRLIGVAYVEVGEVRQPTIFSIQNAEVDSLTHIVAVNISIANVKTDKITVLAYGLIPSSSSAAARLADIFSPQITDYTAQLNLTSMLSDGSLIETMTVGANIDLT